MLGYVMHDNFDDNPWKVSIKRVDNTIMKQGKSRSIKLNLLLSVNNFTVIVLKILASMPQIYISFHLTEKNNFQ